WHPSVVEVNPLVATRAYPIGSARIRERNTDSPNRCSRVDPSNPIHDVTQHPPRLVAFGHLHPNRLGSVSGRHAAVGNPGQRSNHRCAFAISVFNLRSIKAGEWEQTSLIGTRFP